MNTTIRVPAVTAVMIALLLASCDNGFEEMNVDPTSAASIRPEYVLTTSQLALAGTRYEQWRANFIYAESMIQHVATTAGYWSGNFYTLNQSYIEALWDVGYDGLGDGNRAYVKLLQDIIYNHQDDPDMANVVAAARILRVLAFHRLTDSYGDIPYHEAGLGFITQDIDPTYDPQSEIYPHMLSELQAAVAQFDAARPSIGSADLIYGGDISRWRKFGNSLMLRLALRLVKVDPSAAQEWATRAINAGVMENNADIAYLMHQDGPSSGPNGLNSNGVTDVFRADSPRLSELMVSWMKATGDPRLPLFGAVFSGSGTTWPGTVQVVSTDPAHMIGMPNGLDGAALQNHASWSEVENLDLSAQHPDWDELDPAWRYVQPGPLLRNPAGPTIFQSYAEVALMKAEAAHRWGIGNAATEYENGVRAAMEHMNIYSYGPYSGAIDAASIDAYLAANPFDPANALQQINTQYWAATFLNGIEAWANYRRSGFPVLIPINPPGNVTQGRVPSRFVYPNNERLLNEVHYQAAVSRQGPDLMTTRVWWDVQ